MLRGLRDTFAPILIGLLGYWLIGIGFGVWFSFQLGWGASGLWWGFAAGLTFAGCSLLFRLWLHNNRMKG